MSFSDWELCARFLDVPEDVFVVAVKMRDFTPGVVRFYRCWPTSSVDMAPELIVESPGHTGPFPHGLNVEPD